ncbi:VWA domain-containing protein [Empedobacter falsenii]|uniref:VWA domain-containing protein n=1 Tax=Empedobacter falsenii TaxID=343874 RepID=A0ABY8VB66_9FLAO|nr:TerY-C metal binding domain-containing protein [Empedobacter falsenii]WIH98367.1 VWA domain-containing protein [Empedobacter falsenii]
MRRLPIYFLIDVSESMVGEPIEQVEQGIATIIKDLKTDPYALETVWISIIGFAGDSKVITPLQDIITFYPPKFPIGSGTSLSKGLDLLMTNIDNEITKTTFEKKGDWKPIIFLFTDGTPTDNTDKQIDRWNLNYRNKANLVIIALGENTNLNLLNKLSDNVLMFKNTDENSYKEFFKWVTASIKATSEHVNNNKEILDLKKSNSEIIQKIDLSKNYDVPDDNIVVLRGKCSKTEKSYLIKFIKDYKDSGFADILSTYYHVEGAYKIDDKLYNEYSTHTKPVIKVASDELYGNPSCPCCSNHFSLATCSCSGIHCISGEGLNTCPWCGTEAFYGSSDESFDINRTLG